MSLQLPSLDEVKALLEGRGGYHGKRPYPTPPGPSRLPALPVGVWNDGLVPLLARRDLIRLASASKALRELAHEWPVDLGRVPPDQLETALRLSPGAVRVVIDGYPGVDDGDLEYEEEGPVEVDEARMMQVLERGQRLRTVETRGLDATPVFMLSWARRLPCLEASCVILKDREQNIALHRGLLVNLRELSADLSGAKDDVPFLLDSLSCLSLCKHLRRLRLTGTIGRVLRGGRGQRALGGVAGGVHSPLPPPSSP
jgi:hypothetical protein